jgi:hypothetical protein
MVFNFLKKKDYWTELGGVEGYIAAVKQLGSDYHELDNKDNGYTKPDTIWGRLAELTQFSKKHAYETRKWLFTNWHENRRKIRTTFFSTQVNDHLSNDLDQPSNNDEIENTSNVEAVSLYFLISFLIAVGIVNNIR